MAILSVQSHVAYGHVGNRSAVFPLERMGFEVWPVNTVQFSNHTGYGSWRGMVFPEEHVAEVCKGIGELGVAGDCDAVLSGYLGSAKIGRAVLDALGSIRATRPDAVYCCDPVMGDEGRGCYVRPEIPGFFRTEALPTADIVTPNHFEAELLSGMTIRSIAEARQACEAIHDCGPRIVLITSFDATEGREVPVPAGAVSMLLSDDKHLYLVSTPRIAFGIVPNGSGDLAAALFLGQYLKTGNAAMALDAMTEAVYAVLEATAARGARELALVESQEAFVSEKRRFRALRLD